VMLDGGWRTDMHTTDDERRLYYVGMTRAAQTLTLCEFANCNPFSSTLDAATLAIDWQGEYKSELRKQYVTLSLSEIDIGYAGRLPENSVIHRNIAKVSVGSPLHLQEDSGRYLLLDAEGSPLGRTAASFKIDGLIEACTAAAVVVRYAEDSEEKYRNQSKSRRWEVVLPKLILGPVNS